MTAIVRERAPAAFAVVMGLVLILIRPWAVANPYRAPVLLAATYAALAAVSLAVPAGAGKRKIPASLVLTAGLAAVVTSRLIWSLAVPPRASVMGVAFLTVAAISEEAFFRRLVYSRLE